MTGPDNAEIAAALDRIGDLLETQAASPFRVRAYHRGAEISRSWEEPLRELAGRGGRKALLLLPGIGATLSTQILELLRTGRIAMLERLEGQVSPEDQFTLLPGVGETLATRLHCELGADSLEDLEVAAHDGRLEQVAGMGPERARAIRDHLTLHLGEASRRRARALAHGSEPPHPSVELLLAVDREYREAALAGRLQQIAPRRFNPEHRAWLPVLHCERHPWSLTALYSNTARAHELGMTHDWVVIYAEQDGVESRATVVTETTGALRGQRVVRGREAESRAMIQPSPAGPEPA